MKKYSADYFEKKYKILSDKLLQKEGFMDAVKAVRKDLKLPENGFDSPQELAFFFINKMTKSQQESLTFFAFVEAYAYKNKIFITEENRKEVIDAFIKEGYEKGGAMIPMMFELVKYIDSHHVMFTKYPLFEDNKYLSKLFPEVSKLMQKYWSVDLLDDHVIFHYIEKYMFLGPSGINQYIKSKIACHNCKYLGIEHFSPRRIDMEGQDEGPYSKNYILNKEAVRRLSYHFNSVFLIVKPYATKEMLLQYVEDNWNDLKEHIIEKNPFYKQFDVNPSLIKESDDEKNRLVYELNKLSKKELLDKYKGKKDFSHKGIYKEAIVSAILEEEYDIHMAADAVKKTASRFANSIEVKRIPKDIRDI
jgi:hypothetical protein